MKPKPPRGSQQQGSAADNIEMDDFYDDDCYDMDEEDTEDDEEEEVSGGIYLLCTKLTSSNKNPCFSGLSGGCRRQRQRGVVRDRDVRLARKKKFSRRPLVIGKKKKKKNRTDTHAIYEAAAPPQRQTDTHVDFLIPAQPPSSSSSQTHSHMQISLLNAASTTTNTHTAYVHELAKNTTPHRRHELRYRLSGIITHILPVLHLKPELCSLSISWKLFFFASEVRMCS